MVILHGLFNLKEGVTKQLFSRSYNEYADHLSECGFVKSWQVAFRERSDKYDLNGPLQAGVVLLYFYDLEKANSCWDYIEEKVEPIDDLYKEVNSQMTDVSFFLSSEIVLEP